MSKKSGSGLFLMEMLVVVLFFILCASTCILVFVKSNNLSSLARDTNQGVVVSESIAEFFKSDNMEACAEQMKAERLEDGSLQIRLDDQWNYMADTGSHAYLAQVVMSEQEGMEKAVIRITRTSDKKVLYELEVNSYRG